jgi:uncharacterized protein (DUF2132 family)
MNQSSQSTAMPPNASAVSGSTNMTKGITLEAIITALVQHYGWESLANHIAIRCFTHDPSINSSLKFLRRTPWARKQVEELYQQLVNTAN